MRFLPAFLTLGLLYAQSARDMINEGVAQYKKAMYAEAAETFRKAVAIEPQSVNAHSYLATACFSRWVPMSTSPENESFRQEAEQEFRRVLELDPANKIALASLASMSYQQANRLKGADQDQKFAEALAWYRKLTDVDPKDKTAWYGMGVIDWASWYPAYQRARAAAGLQPADPGPLPDASMRRDLRTRWTPVIADGMNSLRRALEIDPDFEEAMAYMNLFIRQRADLEDDLAVYQGEIKKADDWVQKALDARKRKAGQP